MGHYASEMGFGVPSEWEQQLGEKIDRCRERLAKTPLSVFTADYACDLAVVTSRGWRDHKMDADYAVDRILAFFALRDKVRAARKRKQS